MSRRQSRVGARDRALSERAAEGEIVADALDVRAGADQIEVPEPVSGIAEQDRASQPAVRDEQLLVDANARIGEQDFFTALVAEEVAGREQMYAGHLQICREHAAGVASGASRKTVG